MGSMRLEKRRWQMNWRTIFSNAIALLSAPLWMGFITRDPSAIAVVTACMLQ